MGKLFSPPREESDPSPGEETEPEPQVKSEQRTLTDAELQRLIQSEADRREAARNKAARDAERKRLRDEDPWALAELEKQEETQQQQEHQVQELISGIANLHDSATLVPLMNALEPAERERLYRLPNAGFGVDGRKMLIDEALKSLEKRWRAEGAKDAEGKLRKNAAFRKQVFADFGSDQSSEPELLPSGSAGNGRRSSASEDINNMFRQQVGIPTRK